MRVRAERIAQRRRNRHALVRGERVAAHVLLVDLELDAAINAIAEARAQVAREAVAAPSVRIVSPHRPAGRPRAKRRLPADAQAALAGARRVVQQADVGTPLAAIELGLTEYDRETVWAFAEGFGYALERCVLADRLRQQSAQVVALVRSTEASVVELSRSEIELDAPAVRQMAPQRIARAANALEDDLTRRELEVISMLAEGETNARIARRLVVSEDTVKTHVKHILRKLGVHNRAQAVSRYFLAKDDPFESPKSPLGSMRHGS